MENQEDTKFPDLKWAQRKDRVFVTIDLPGATDTKIDLKPDGHLSFSGKVKDQKYAIEIDLYKEVITEDSKWNLRGRNVILNIVKKDQEDEYWPRITKEKIKHPHIKVDWDKWIEEDDENATPDNADLMGDWDPNNMQDFGAGDYEDSDDDEEEEVQDDGEAKADLDDLDGDEEADTAPKTQEASTG